MSTNSSSKRCTRRGSRDLNRAKMNLNVDLNAPPAEAALAQSSELPTPPPVAVAEGGGGEAAGAPIDLEASDDDLQLLSSPRGFQQARNQSRRRNRSVIVVVDEEQEINTGTSGVRVNEDDPIAKRTKTSKGVPDKVVSPPPKEPNFTCPICMGSLVSPCSTVCGHIFCEGCIKAAIQVKKICPTCRTKLTMKNNFHKVFLPTATND